MAGLRSGFSCLVGFAFSLVSLEEHALSYVFLLVFEMSGVPRFAYRKFERRIVFLEWPVFSFVCGMLFDPLARPSVCLERLFLVGSAQRGASMEAKL